MILNLKYIDTIYGKFQKTSKKRLDLAFDYEATEINVFRRIVNLLGSTHVVDVGANIGLYSIASLELFSVRSVTGVEAANETFDEMMSNFGLQETDKELVGLNFAVSDQKAALKFRHFGTFAGNNAIHSTSFMPADVEFETVEVEADLLDNVFTTRNCNLALKIDVEGHEIEVLKGAKEVLGNCTGFLQIEIIGQGNRLKVESLLAELNYDLVGWLKYDYYFVHRSLVEKNEDIRTIFFEELQVALTRLEKLNVMRRRVLRTCRNIGDEAYPVRKVARFKKDPLFDPMVYTPDLIK